MPMWPLIVLKQVAGRRYIFIVFAETDIKTHYVFCL